MSSNAVVVLSPEELRMLVAQAVREEVGALVRATRRAMEADLNEEEAAAYLRISANTLRQWRTLKRGPAYQKAGRNVRYTREALDIWKKSCSVLTLDTLEARHG